MRRNNRLLLPLIGCVLGLLIVQIPVRAEDDSPWRLNDCIEQGIQTSPRLRSTHEQLIRAEATYREERASRLGTVDFTGSYSHNTEVQKLSLSIPLPTGTINREMSFGDGNNYDFAATAKVPLYTGGAVTNRINAAKADRSATRYDLQSDSAAYLAEIRRYFFTALGAEQAYRIAVQTVTTLTRHRDEVKRKLEVGTASEEQLTMAEAALMQGLSNCTMAQSDQQAARLALGNAIGLPGKAITPNGELHNSLLDNVSYPTKWNARPELQAIELRIQQSQSNVKATRSAFFPMVSAMASYHYAKPGVDAITNDWMDYAIIGANFSWTLWDGNARQERIARTTSQMHTMREKQTELQNALQTQYEVALSRVELANTTALRVEARKKLIDRRMAMVEDRYRVGAAIEQEWLDAQDDATNAELALTNAMVRVRVSEVELLAATAK